MGYLNNWFRVINEMGDDQLFKAAWARSIFECIEKGEVQKNNTQVVISEYNIVKKLMKYYWNIHSYYGLKMHAPKRIITHVNDLEKMFYENKYISKHVWYNEIDAFFNYYPIIQEQEIKKFMTLAHKGYDYKFLMIKREQLPLYEIDTTMKQLIFSANQVKVVKEYTKELSKLIHYKWCSVLEKHYHTPHLIYKLVQSQADKLPTNNFKKEMKFLIEYHHQLGIKDFFTGNQLSFEDTKVIPIFPLWYIGEAPIWNLVLVAKDYKNNKSDVISKETIEVLKDRNKTLLVNLENNNSSFKKELFNANIKEIIDRLFVDYLAVSK